jgi:hypothetical protein
MMIADIDHKMENKQKNSKIKLEKKIENFFIHTDQFLNRVFLRNWKQRKIKKKPCLFFLFFPNGAKKTYFV